MVTIGDYFESRHYAELRTFYKESFKEFSKDDIEYMISSGNNQKQYNLFIKLLSKPMFSLPESYELKYSFIHYSIEIEELLQAEAGWIKSRAKKNYNYQLNEMKKVLDNTSWRRAKPNGQILDIKFRYIDKNGNRIDAHIDHHPLLIEALHTLDFKFQDKHPGEIPKYTGEKMIRNRFAKNMRPLIEYLNSVHKLSKSNAYLFIFDFVSILGYSLRDHVDEDYFKDLKD